MPRADVLIGQTAALLQFNGGGTSYPVLTDAGVMYAFYVDSNSDIAYKKSTDYGLSWSAPVVVSGAITATAFAIWYDRWSGISGDLIHICWAESAADDISYRNMNTASSDALSTTVSVFLGASTAAGGSISITRARGGDIICAGSIDAGTEDGAWRTQNVGATDFSAIADPSEAATQDQYLLLPGWNADNQDVMLIFWDASANELSVKRYDASANSWTETSIATGMTDTPAATSFPHVAGCVDLANSRNIVVAWSAVDTLNANLRMWFINDTTITESTANVVLNSVDDQALCAVGVDTTTGRIYVVYGGKSDGSETVGTSINLYYKTTMDDGATWSAEQVITPFPLNIKWLAMTPRFNGPAQIGIMHNNDATLDTIRMLAAVPVRLSGMQELN